jgi:hypothetical protein
MELETKAAYGYVKCSVLKRIRVKGRMARLW